MRSAIWWATRRSSCSAVAHVVAAIGATGDAAISQEVRAFATPVVMGDGRVDVQAGTGGVDQAELARAGQVGADHFSQGAAVGVVHREIGDGYGVLGCASTGNINAQLGMDRFHRHQAGQPARGGLREGVAAADTGLDRTVERRIARGFRQRYAVNLPVST
ncbi:hypothetical protein G6F65_018369 [Rhizopus arrhizus]|nr:hypothetical protein G6F65_018369 [Rhizopus arrhizus]